MPASRAASDPSRAQRARRSARLAREDVAARLQAGDHTLWSDDPAGISDRLGWLTAPEEFAGRVEELEGFASAAVADGA